MASNDLETKHLETLDRDLGRFSSLEKATSYIAKPLVAPALALIFIIIVGILAATTLSGVSNTIIIVIAAVLGAYMALNIGANDVANNMGPAVGANALTMAGAILIAAIFESAGALIAGGIAAGVAAARDPRVQNVAQRAGSATKDKIKDFLVK